MERTEKYAKLLGVAPDSDLPEIKQKYQQWRTRFESQVASGNPQAAQKGQKNLVLLDEAYQALASQAVAAARQQQQAEAAEDAGAQADLPMSIELDSCRVGFNMNNMEGFTFVNSHHVRKFKVSWPGGKMTFFNNKLKIGALVFSTEIEYRQVEEIKRFWFMPMTFQIKHRAPSVLPVIIVFGPGLGGLIKRLNDEHRLGLNLSY